MSDRNNPLGDLERYCKECGKYYRTDWDRSKYCSEACKRSRANRDNYLRRKEKKNRV